MEALLIVYNYLRRNWSKIVIGALIWLMFTLMYVTDVYGANNYYTTRGLVYFWDFENERAFTSDIKANAQAFAQGKVRWIPPEFSFNDTGVIHVHGDKNPISLFIIPSARFDKKDLSYWTIDFEFACGTHAVDHEDHAAEGGGRLVDGNVFEWGDIVVKFFRSPRNPEWEGILAIEYRGREAFIEKVRGFDYHHMAIRSEDVGISVWYNTRFIEYFNRPRRTMQGQKVKFGGSRFAGRFDDIKLYNVRLRPWEIVSNYHAEELLVDPKEKLITTWGKLKNEMGY